MTGMPSWTPLLCCLPVVLALAGCGDEYYQTRYIPPSSDSSFTLASRATWSGDKQVYELPPEPPAVGVDRPRQDCIPPGGVIPDSPLVGIRDADGHFETGEVVTIAGTYDEPMHSLPPDKQAPIYAYDDPHPPGPVVPIGAIPVAGTQQPPFAGSSSQLIEPVPLASYRTDQTLWCNVDK